MKLTIFNGSPKGSRGNTQKLLDKFIEGFMSGNAKKTNKNDYEIHNIYYDIKSADDARNLFTNAECVMLAFPLHSWAMPSAVMSFIKYLESLCGKDNNPDMFFLVQFGFPEATHARNLERYLDKLTKLLNCKNLGVIIKGGCEGLDNKPKFMTKPIFDGAYKIGKYFGENGVFDKEFLAEYSKPERMGRISARIFIFFGNRTFWKPRLKKYGTLQKHGDRPYLNG